MRRLKITSEYIKKDEMEKILKFYMDSLTGMGYSKGWRTKAMRSSMVGYMKVLHKAEIGETDRIRKRKDMLLNRRIKNLLGNQHWFKVDDTSDDSDMQEVSGEHKGAKGARE